ncbi:TetR/AcrR family transcriptional regulator [Actinocatenispora rupis]|uniref:HTH tetR-type domain-containing protein n=1 Tax=Actinocatenispora rupis TaxID=519421 RepID=A0A8J3J5R4_9ACTN|nr:TetR/AcrR family transcriptional regulator [Actinocatenispora rupis]GID09868.1 hypothetical protein Aru02nite_07570 [Actinocatenispora rupis]
MDDSLRERKKRQTRQALAAAALRLFTEQGYERTTVAQIAAAADVSVRTLFNHFPTKDDVLFGNDEHAAEIPVRVIAGRRPRESVSALLVRAYEEMLADNRVNGLGTDTAVLAGYVRLVTTVPALQARALRSNHQLQRRMAYALVEVAPELDLVGAAAMIGAVAGAAQAAAFMSMELGQSDRQFWAALRRGVETAVRGAAHPPRR